MTAKNGFTRSSFHPGLGRQVPLDREVWTGSPYADPRRLRVTTRSAQIEDQPPATKAFLHRDANVLPVTLVFRAADGFPIQVGGDVELSTVTVTDGRVFFLMTLDPSMPPRPGLREYVQVDMPEKGDLIVLSFYQVPDDRLAQQILSDADKAELAAKATADPNATTRP